MRTSRTAGVLRASRQRGPVLLLATLVALVALAVLPVGAMAAPGRLDPSFGSAGKALIDFGGSDGAWAVAAQPSDGKLVLAGETSAGAKPNDFAVVRLNANGSPDASFGVGGKKTIDFGGDDRAFAVALQPDGKIVVAGQTSSGGATTFAVARLNPDGSLDGSFGPLGDGKSPISIPNTKGVATSVLVRPDGEIIVVGTTTVPNSQADFTAVWLSPNGLVDSLVGDTGVKVVDFGADDNARGATLQADGKIVIAGDSTAGAGGHDFAAARLNPNGSVDSAFGTGGKVTVDFGGDDGADAAVVQPDGKVLLTGDTTAAADAGDLAVARLNANGSVDTSFGAGGKSTFNFGGQDLGRAAALQPDGAIILAGGTASAGGEDFTIARLSPAGGLDGSFGTGGKATVDFGGVDVARAVLLRPDGTIVAAGVGGAGDFAVARLLGGGGGPGPLPPPNARQCRASVLALVRGAFRCVRVSGLDDRLLPGRADVPGYRSAGGGSRVARAALSDPVSRALRRGRAQGAAFRARGRGLSIGVFSFSSSARAASGLRALAHGRRRVALGRGVRGLLRVRSTRKTTDVAIAFRTGRAIGAVRLRARGRRAGARAAVVAYARQLAGRLRRVLALTAWQRTVDGIGPDGSITPKLALQAFAIVYGPLPGVRRPAGPAGGPPDGTSAILMVYRVWDRLSAAQHRAIDRYLGAPHDASSPRSARPSAEPVLTPSPRYQAIAEKYNGIYRAKLPSAQPVTVQAFTVPVAIGKNGTALMDSLPVDASGRENSRRPAYCRVRVGPRGQANADPERLMAHELVHCYQFALNPNWRSLKQWIMDGMAEWGAETVTGRDSINWLAGYMSTPTKPLFQRTYDAIGFFGHADEVAGRGSLWAKIPGILTAGGDAASYATAGGTSPAFVGTWASAPWRFPAAGEAWHQTDPLALGTNAPTLPFTTVTDDANLRSQPYALGEYTVIANGERPLVQVVGNDVTRAGTTRRDFGVVNGSQWFCLGMCKCPPNEEGTVPPHESVVNAALDLAVTGGAAAGQDQILYHSMKEFCKGKKPKEPSSGGGGRGGGPGLEVRGLTSGSPILGRITSGSCGFVGKGFRAVGSGSGYRFEMRITGARRPGQYTIPNNNSATYVKLRSGGKSYSTIGRNTTVLGVTGPRDAGLAIIQKRRVRVGKRTVVRYRIAVGIDDLVSGGKPGVALLPGRGGLAC